jgi:hypothetical protein
MKKDSAALGGALLALVLSGCGGGGGDGPAPPPGPPATGTINNGSVLAVSGRSANAAFQSSKFGDITNVVGLTTLATHDPAILGSGIVSKSGGWPAWSQIPVGPETTPCVVDGTVTVSGDIASPLTVTAGDFLDYEWENCDDGLGQVINGLIGMTFTEFSGNLLAGRILLGVSLAVQGFQVSEGTESRRTNGDLNLTIDSRTQPKTTVATLGNSLIISNGTSTETLTDFSSTVTEDTSMFPSNFTTDATGRVSSTQFNGEVSYDTPVAFQATGDAYPYKGEMMVFGQSGARVRIIAMDRGNVRIEADYNGDGASDATIDTTWAALVGD